MWAFYRLGYTRTSPLAPSSSLTLSLSLFLFFRLSSFRFVAFFFSLVLFVRFLFSPSPPPLSLFLSFSPSLLTVLLHLTAIIVLLSPTRDRRSAFHVLSADHDTTRDEKKTHPRLRVATLLLQICMTAPAIVRSGNYNCSLPPLVAVVFIFPVRYRAGYRS